MTRITRGTYAIIPVLIALTFVRPATGATVVRFGEKYYDGAAGRYRSHRGIDIACPTGSDIRAAADGKIAFAGNTPRGLCVTILHRNGVKTTYLPLRHILVAKGEPVFQGQVIGVSKADGDKSHEAPHLHMGAVFAGDYIDPESLFSGEYKADMTKLIRRANIPPAGAGYRDPAENRIREGGSGGGKSILGRAWDSSVTTLSFIGRQTVRAYMTGSRWFARRFSRGRAARSLSGFITSRRGPVVSAASGITVFDPSGDQDDPNSRLCVLTENARPVLSISVYDSSGWIVTRLDGWQTPSGAVFWSGDDDTGRLVEQGLYSVVAGFRGSKSRVFLAEVRWHL